MEINGQLQANLSKDWDVTLQVIGYNHSYGPGSLVYGLPEASPDRLDLAQDSQPLQAYFLVKRSTVSTSYTLPYFVVCQASSNRCSVLVRQYQLRSQFTLNQVKVFLVIQYMKLAPRLSSSGQHTFVDLPLLNQLSRTENLPYLTRQPIQRKNPQDPTLSF